MQKTVKKKRYRDEQCRRNKMIFGYWEPKKQTGEKKKKERRILVWQAFRKLS